MEDFLKLFNENDVRRDLYEKRYTERFGIISSYPLHPPHAVSKDQLKTLGSGHFFALKRDGVNAFLLTSPDGMWLMLRSGKLLFSKIQMDEYFVDVEMCESVVYFLDAVRNTDADFQKPFSARYMMRARMVRAFKDLGVTEIASQEYWAQSRLEFLLDSAEEGVIAVPFIAPFPTAFHTSVQKYKHVETIDVEIIPSCKAADVTGGQFECDCQGECQTPVPVAVCRQNNSDLKGVIALKVPEGPYGLYECTVDKGLLRRVRFRADKKYPNRWSTIKGIAHRDKWEAVQSTWCAATRGAHDYMMSADTLGMCSQCCEQMSFQDGIPRKGWIPNTKGAWLDRCRKRNPPVALVDFLSTDDVSRPWELDDTMILGAIKKDSIESVREWLLKHPMPRNLI